MKTSNRLYPVVEMFSSINGEGQFSGELAVFVRFKGCNLTCHYCDTKWANADDAECSWLSLDQIIAHVKSIGIVRVTLTGGEPLNVEGVHLLIEALLTNGFHVEIETNGSVPIRGLKTQFSGEKLHFTVDYKLPGSGMESCMKRDNYTAINEKDCVKFVIVDLVDFNRALECIREYDMESRTHIYLSVAFGSLSLQTVVEQMKMNNLNHVKLQLQLHKYIWNAAMRGV